MTRPYLIPEGSKEKLKAALKSARSADVLRRVLYASGCGWNSVWAPLKSRPRWDGPCAPCAICKGSIGERATRLFEGPGKGGRRNELMSTRQEFALLRSIRQDAFPSGVISYQDVHQAVEKAVGRRVDFSTVHRMLKRHGWYRKALVAMPNSLDPSAPKWGPANRTGVWYMPLEDEPQTGPAAPAAGPSPASLPHQ